MERTGLNIRAAKIWGALLVLLCFYGAAFGQHVQGSDKIATPASYDALASKIKKTGSVRLIVKVDAPFQPMGRPDSPDSKRQMNGIAVAQDAVFASLTPFKPKSSYKYSYTPYLFVEVDSPALQALLASPLVLDVHEDTPEFPALDVSVPLVGAPSLWNLYAPDPGFDGSGVTVAVLDTGVDNTHPFLVGAVVSEACYSTNSTGVNSLCPGGVTHSTAADSALPYASGVCPATKCNHGTHVAGIIGGRRDVDGSPGPGVAPGAGIIAIQVFSLVDGLGVAAFQSDIMKGLERVYALRSAYNIASVNMSLGSTATYPGNCDTDPRKPIIESLKAAGIATVISSGNNGASPTLGSCGAISAPACISSAVSVGATDDTDVVAAYSNSASFMSLLAPGSAIMSSVPGPTYQSWSGTSMAAPHVAGAWALLKQAKPGSTVDQLLNTFTSTSPQVGVSVTDSKCLSVTKNRISVSDAYNMLGTDPSARTNAATNITQTTATLNGTVNANNTSTTVTFDYGTDTSYGSTVTALQSPASGSGLTSVSQGITGLTGNTLYHYRVNAGAFHGNDMTFTTVGACAAIADGSFEGGSPNASWVESSTYFGSPLCTVDICDGAGPRTGAWWAWFGSASGATETASLTQDVVIPSGSVPRLEFYLWNNTSSGNGNDALKVMVDGSEILFVAEGNLLYGSRYVLTGLDLSAYADGVFHSVSFQSTTTGPSPTDFNLDDVSITCGNNTTLPIVATEAATSVTTTGATLNGTVNANNASTAVTFEYGTTISYGSTVTAVPGPVTGSSNVAINAPLTGLLPGTTYHYRAAGSSVTGMSYGGDMAFTPTCSPDTVKIGETPYGSIQLAITGAADSDALIQVKAADFAENLSFGGAGTITLKGGYDCAFVSNTGFTYVTGVSGTGGSITLGGGGKVIIENIVVQ